MKKIILFISSCVLAFLAICYIWYVSGTAPVNSDNKSTQVFNVNKGEGVYSIAKRLEQANLIKNSSAFVWLVRIEHLGSQIQAGDFRLSPSMNAEQIAKDLSHGSLDIVVT